MMDPREPHDELPDDVDDWQPEHYEAFTIEADVDFRNDENDQFVYAETFDEAEDKSTGVTASRNGEARNNSISEGVRSIADSQLEEYQSSKDPWDGIKAAAAFRNVAKNPDKALAILRDVYRLNQSDRKVSASALTTAAAVLVDKGSFAKAEKVVNDYVLKIDPNCAPARRVLARIRSLLDDPERARAEWARAEKIDPSDR